jgi:hypothetical protein
MMTFEYVVVGITDPWEGTDYRNDDCDIGNNPGSNDRLMVLSSMDAKIDDPEDEPTQANRHDQDD